MKRFYHWMSSEWAWRITPSTTSRLPRLLSFLARFRTWLRTPRGHTVEHLALVFASTFAVDAAGNARHVFEAHGLNGLKAAGYGIAAAALAAAYRATKPQLRRLLTSRPPRKAP